MRARKFVVFLAASAFLAWVGLAPVTAADESRHNAWTIPDTLRMAVSIQPNSLNPILATTAVETDIARFAFDGLLAYTMDGTAFPKLASEVPSLENGGISRDGKTLTYHLRHNVRWHDGQPFTSRDVAFTQRAIMNPKNNLVTRLGYEDVERLETPNDFTVVFKMRRAFSPALTALFGYANVLPEHLLGKYEDLNRVDFNSTPIGTGPFKVVKWVRGDRIEYVANDEYFLGRPKLRKITVRIITDDNTMATQMRTHELDWAMRVQTLTYRDLKTTAGLRALALKQNAYRAIILNTSKGPLRDVRVRRAIAAAIDKSALVQRVAFGTADAAIGDLPPLSYAFDPGVHGVAYDPAAARRELEPRKLTLTLTFVTGQRESQTVATLVQDSLERAGVHVTLRSFDASVLFAPEASGGVLARGNFDLNVSSFIGRPDPDDSRQLTCSNRRPRGFNYSDYCSPRMEAAQRDSLAAFDRGKRRAAVSRIQQTLVDEVPLIYVWWPRELHVINSDLHGIDDPPGLASQLPYLWKL